MSGFSYIVLANLMNSGSGVETENSLYPCVASRPGTTRPDRPSVGDVAKCASVSCAAVLARPCNNLAAWLTHLDRVVRKLGRGCVSMRLVLLCVCGQQLIALPRTEAANKPADRALPEACRALRHDDITQLS